MSWIQKLYETYINCEQMVGVGADDNEVSLLPICHTTQKAQIEIVLNQDGIFKKARVIPKNEARTIIPSTERAAGRTHINAHALCDKLQYVAKDYREYGGKKKSGYEKVKGHRQPISIIKIEKISTGGEKTEKEVKTEVKKAVKAAKVVKPAKKVVAKKSVKKVVKKKETK